MNINEKQIIIDEGAELCEDLNLFLDKNKNHNFYKEMEKIMLKLDLYTSNYYELEDDEYSQDISVDIVQDILKNKDIILQKMKL